MARPLRHFSPGDTVEVTIRTVQGRFLIRPSDEMNEIILGILGLVLVRFGLQIHAFVFMSNHYHLIVTIPDALALARFECFLNGNLAKEACRLHGWKDKLWSRRYRAIPILDDVAMVDRLRYLLSHGCKEGLVERPIDWPGVSSLSSMLSGTPERGYWFDRTAEYTQGADERGDRYAYATPHEVVLSPLPCWAHLSETKQRDQIEDLVEEIVAATGARNIEDRHTPPGPSHILRQNPESRPERPKRSPAPPCHTSIYSLKKLFIAAYYTFLDAYHEASIRFRSGDLDTEFPADCFPPPLPFRGVQAHPAPS